MNFIVYDIALLVAFVLFLSIFIYRRKENLKKEGLLLLYKTSWGIKLINKIGSKYKRALKVLGYVSIALGYCLMAGIFYMLGKILWIYITQREVVKMIKLPPIMPLLPYVPQVFKLDFLPPFYFTYWIIIIAIVAIVHEFSHGIFAARDKIKIKKTGFGLFPFFLPIFLAAFVEIDEKQMAKKSKFTQMSVLSGGTFANVLTAVLFFFVFWGFFSLSFSPAGVTFDTYSYSIVKIANISSINGIAVHNLTYGEISGNINTEGLNTIKANNRNYLLNTELISKQKNIRDYIFLYEDAPAIKENLQGAIISFDGVKTPNREKLAEEIYKHSPGDEIIVKTKNETGTYEHNIVLGKNPESENLPLLGIGFVDKKDTGIFGKITGLLYTIKKPNIYYEPRFNAALFIYNLLWWLVLINFSVALVNMLPVGIFDGGRFLFLTAFAITKSEKKAKLIFKIVNYVILGAALVLMIFWFLSFW